MSKESSVRFKAVKARDFPVLLRMMRSLAEHPPAIAFDEGEVRAALRKFLARPQFGHSWLICLRGQVVGYVILTLGYSFEYRWRDAFVDELYIEPGFRRVGLGRGALEFVERGARKLGVNALHLEVDAGNDAALELYRRSGYASHGRYLMTKWLR